MNAAVLRLELKNYRKNLLFWSIGMFVFIGGSMAKYDSLSRDSQAANDLVSQLPQSVQAVFGLNGLDISQIDGYFGVLFIYLILIGAVHAVLLGSDIVAKEERNRTSEFLYVKPISRRAILTQKLLAGMVYLVGFNIVACVSSLYLVGLFDGGESIAAYIILLMYALFAIQVLFFSVGVAVASSSRKPKRSASLATATLLATYVIFFFVNISSNLDFLKYITPFKYFDAKTILETSSLPAGYVVLTLAIIVGLTLSSYRSYHRRDFEV